MDSELYCEYNGLSQLETCIEDFIKKKSMDYLDFYILVKEDFEERIGLKLYKIVS